jgi:hypothetical protein
MYGTSRTALILAAVVLAAVVCVITIPVVLTQDKRDSAEAGAQALATDDKPSLVETNGGLSVAVQESDPPSDVPSQVPSDKPSFIPSDVPSTIPSDFPSSVPSDVPSAAPSLLPLITVDPKAPALGSDFPSLAPFSWSTQEPTVGLFPDVALIVDEVESPDPPFTPINKKKRLRMNNHFPL